MAKFKFTVAMTYEYFVDVELEAESMEDAEEMLSDAISLAERPDTSSIPGMDFVDEAVIAITDEDGNYECV